MYARDRVAIGGDSGDGPITVILNRVAFFHRGGNQREARRLLFGVSQAISSAALAAVEIESSAEQDAISRARLDRAAFAPIYRAHYAAIVGYLFRRTGDTHAAEDLAAETFLAAIRTVHRFRPGRASVRAWLYRIATNEANRWARKRRRGSAWSLRGAAAVPVGAPDDPPPGDDWSAAHTALVRIHPRYQAVLVLHYVEGLSVEQVGAVLGCRAGTVKSRLSRGREALRNELEPSHG